MECLYCKKPIKDLIIINGGCVKCVYCSKLFHPEIRKGDYIIQSHPHYDKPPVSCDICHNYLSVYRYAKTPIICYYCHNEVINYQILDDAWTIQCDHCHQLFHPEAHNPNYFVRSHEYNETRPDSCDKCHLYISKDHYIDPTQSVTCYYCHHDLTNIVINHDGSISCDHCHKTFHNKLTRQLPSSLSQAIKIPSHPDSGTDRCDICNFHERYNIQITCCYCNRKSQSHHLIYDNHGQLTLICQFCHKLYHPNLSKNGILINSHPHIHDGVTNCIMCNSGHLTYSQFATRLT